MGGIKKLIGATMAALGLAVGAASPAFADYPDKPVTFILPNGAGGAADINLRIILKHLEKHVPAKLIVKNIKGGATATGTRAAYDAPKDGYTLLFFHQAFMGTAAQGILGREFRDMVPVARAGSIDIMYAAAKDAPFDDILELISYAKENPGAVKVGVFLRAHSHMVALKVMDALGVEFNMINIPGGGGPIRAALVGHQIDLGITSVSESAKYFESGDIKPLFVFRPVSVQGLEELPSAEESGFPGLADVGSVTNYFWAHKDVPEDVRTYWADKIEQVMADPELQEELGQRIMDLRFARGEELQEEVDAQYANTVAIVEKFDLKTGKMNKRARALETFPRPGQQGWLGLLLVLTMSALTAVAANLPPPQFEPVGARLLAMAIPMTLCALGIVLLVKDLRRGGEEAEDEASGLGAHVLLRPGALYGVLVTYTYLVSLGLQNWLYVCISGAFAGLIAALVQTQGRPVIIALAAIVGTLLSAGIAWSFANFLYVDIAR